MLCWLKQRALSRAVDAGGELPPSLRAHVVVCPRCREHHTAQRRVAGLLAAENATAHEDTPPFLHGRIMTAIRANANEAEPAGLFPRGAWAGVAALAVVAASVWVSDRHPGGVAHTNELTMRAGVNANTDAPDLLPGVPALDLTQLGQRLDAPLAAEASAVMADARSAMEMLAQNFVPSQWRAQEAE